MNDKYRAYLLSPTWAAIKLDLLHTRGQRCERCQKKTKYLQVHHLTYARIFKEEPEDLLLVCDKCHKKEHGITKKNKKPKHDKVKIPADTEKVFKHRIKDPQKVLKAKNGRAKKVKQLTEKNPVAVALKRNSNGRYKTPMDFHIALKSAKTRCKKWGISYAHLLPA